MVKLLNVAAILVSSVGLVQAAAMGPWINWSLWNNVGLKGQGESVNITTIQSSTTILP